MIKYVFIFMVFFMFSGLAVAQTSEGAYACKKAAQRCVNRVVQKYCGVPDVLSCPTDRNGKIKNADRLNEEVLKCRDDEDACNSERYRKRR